MSAPSDYYDRNASAFFCATVNVDMSELHRPFLSRIREGGHILDAGCGSGRDAKLFAERGFRVTAFDASEELAALASHHCGFHVFTRTFEEVNEQDVYDGIWACASLLHVPASRMDETLARLWRALKPGGCFYVSFKFGSGERDHDGRRFTDADEATLRHWMAAFADADVEQVWVTHDKRPERAERWLNAIATKKERVPKLVTGGTDPFLPHLSKAISGATDIAFAVAFIKTTGLKLLLPDLKAALMPTEAEHHKPSRIRILTSDYLSVTDPDALRLLLLLQEQGAEVRVYETQNDSFHLKAYIFARESSCGVIAEGAAFIGSSNISQMALQSGLEWNYRVVYPGEGGYLEAKQRFEELFLHSRSAPLTDAWIEAYEKRRVPPPMAIAPGTDEKEPPPKPTSVQAAALEKLAATRAEGFRRGLVVLATGLGKTWLAAFDVAQVGARRVLFVAHREEILQQAAETFVRIRPGIRAGLYTGKSRDAEVDVLCASVQTLARAAHLERFAPQHFDYMTVDEFHHAAAATYRRLLGHFAPSFLLGLTATPDRTDQSDILSLCDDNLVFSCGLFEGIKADLLAPFHYYGILDEAVDYKEIPWRNGRFDPEELSNKLATLARARHALKEWRARAQKHTLAFCVSIKHAEFMAAHFRNAGIPAAAVYAGSAVGRAEALNDLALGTLSVIFSVDLFNEGVDLPSIDTVMMLRPTESKILFLQQLGRGLRRSEFKTHLTVLDFIGNHHSFLQKPPALFGIGTTYRDLAAFARAAEQHRLPLPDGCYVNYDLRIIDLLKSLDDDGTAKEYEALRSTLGRRPTLTEFYRSGASIQAMRQQYGSWFELAQQQGDLIPAETMVLGQQGKFLRELETTAMTKCFKMVLLEAFLELGGLQHPVTLRALAERSWDVLHRRPKLLPDLPQTIQALGDAASPQWQRYWRDNPVNAWIGGNQADPSSAHFKVADDRLVFASSVPPETRETTAEMIQELVDFRLANYEARQAVAEAATNVIPFPTRNRVELPFFPNLKIACGHFRTGRTDAEQYRALPFSYGKLDPKRHFIARASGNSMNGGKHPIRDGDYLLLELLGPTNAGSITGSVMAIERQDEYGDNQYLLRVVTKNAAGQHVLRAANPDYEDLLATAEMRTLARFKATIDPLDAQIGCAFAREEIPALFGEQFNPGNWNSGHVVLADKKTHVLLVTLNKQGKAAEHRYHDHWVDERTFHWQSQNSTSPTSKRGLEIIRHVQLGIEIHLFVREGKLAGGKGAPFVYEGKLQYASHAGSEPMNVTFTLY